MACNVFGSPITNSTLLKTALPKHSGITPTREERAQEALISKNTKDKDVNARKYLEKLREENEDEEFVCSLCLIYNATGDPLTLSSACDWEGLPIASHYPLRIENGQWGALFHRQISADSCSSGGVVYSFSDYGREYFCCIAWSTPSSGSSLIPKVYGEVVDGGEFGDAKWGRVRTALNNSGLHHRSKPINRVYSVISTCSSRSAVIEVLLTLSGI